MTASGEFWVAGEEARKFRGRIEIDRLGSSTLFLKGKQSDLMTLEREQNFHIHGVVSGNPVTLFDCFNMSPELELAISGEARIITNLTLTQEHLPSMDTKHFDGMEFSPDGLEEWTGLRGFVEKLKTFERFTIKYKKTGTRPVTVSDGVKLSFCTHAILTTNAEGRREFAEPHAIRLEFSGKRSVSELLHQEAIWRSFISFAMRRPAVTPWLNLEAGKRRSVLLMPRYEIHGERGRPLFTRRAVSSRMSRAARAWFRTYARLEPVIALHVGLLFQSRLHLPFQFLVCAQAIEALHRRTNSNKRILPKPAFETVKKRLEDAVPDRYAGKNRIVEKFEFLNEITLADRLRDLYRAEKNLLIGLFPLETDLVAVKNIRNYLTHFSGRKAAKIEGYLHTREFMILTRKLRLVLEIFILKEIGLGTVMHALVSANHEYKWLSREPHGKLP